ncbi:MAG TPA: SHOCT domain-containing protein [Solirubrobacteraceae bacterium]|nr:SHOCT domain-containing protein [Solirubrobacteraceae bacterium]
MSTPPDQPKQSTAPGDPPAAPTGGMPGREHVWLVRTMLGLAAILSVVGIFAVWANRQLLDTAYWTETNTKLLENPAIQEELSSYLTDQIYANVNVAGEIRAGLPSELKPLAGPAAGGLRNVVEKGIVLALQQPRVQELWKSANDVTHKQFVNLIENKSTVIKTPGGGAVYLSLRPIVAELAKRLGAPSSTAEKIPNNIAQIKIVSSKSLETAQAAVRLLRALAVIVPALVLLLFAGAIGLARGRRARTLLNVGVICVGAGLVALGVRSLAGTQVVNTLATTEAVRPAANAAWSIGTSVLADVAGALIFIGVFVVLAGLLGGASRWARSTRHALAPYLRDRPDITFGVAVVALLILFAWGPIHATQTLTGILLITILVLFGTQMLRRQTAFEFPDARAGGMDALRGGWASVRGSFSRGSASVRSGLAGRGHAGGDGGAGSGAGGGDSVEKLERLASLHASGALTDEEFAAAKREMLSR